MSLPFTVALCQSFQETEIGSGAIQGENVIVRNYNDSVVVMYNYDYDLSDGENRFTVRKLSTTSPNSISFKLPDIYTLGGTPFPTPPYNNGGKILYRIHDMRIFEDTCYFCGEKKTTTGDYYIDTNGHPTYQTTDIGLVGKFTISKLFNGINDLELVTIPNIVSLRRMTVYPASQGYSISMIGVPDVSSPTCIVDLYRNPSTGQWIYDAAHPSIVQEILTDITFTDGTVITVSGIVYDNYSFIIRQTKAAWVLTDPSTCIHTPYLFHTNTAIVLSNPSVLPTERDYLVPLYLCPERNESPCYYVAHECRAPHYGIAVYRMKVDDFCIKPLNSANQYIMGPPSVTKLYDMAFCSTPNTLFLLTTNPVFNSFYVQLASFANTTDYSDYQYYKSDRNIHSLDIINTSEILYGGSNAVTDNIFQTITFTPHSSPPSSSCRTFNAGPIFILDSLKFVNTQGGLNVFMDNKKVAWEPYNCGLRVYGNTSVCRF